MKIKVTLTTENGEVLDQFLVEPNSSPRSQIPLPENEAVLAAQVRSVIEVRFEVGDTP
jgi:hypothetical protein